MPVQPLPFVHRSQPVSAEDTANPKVGQPVFLEVLKQQGIVVARRTIAKYRESLDSSGQTAKDHLTGIAMFTRQCEGMGMSENLILRVLL